ncbi:G1/S-specific cyclin CLN1 [Reticulomyxa filosa]|uniref:G1/S-specific cyclin CLN1 n=1 Tax=Reticulomyxa filosa TaxID=46433 RepID=X6P5X0_RETFI|nr:G1/S-specific cyclin CLN1 [Reticulomyxa filosa]|eukprot:ETO33012.1 G1/S-specific cyclin CLN1 [Reticulomyxa filosa]
MDLLNGVDSQQHTPLWRSIELDNLEMTYALLEMGSNINQINSHGQTVAHLIHTLYPLHSSQYRDEDGNEHDHGIDSEEEEEKEEHKNAMQDNNANVNDNSNDNDNGYHVLLKHYKAETNICDENGKTPNECGVEVLVKEKEKEEQMKEELQLQKEIMKQRNKFKKNSRNEKQKWKQWLIEHDLDKAFVSTVVRLLLDSHRLSISQFLDLKKSTLLQMLDNWSIVNEQDYGHDKSGSIADSDDDDDDDNDYSNINEKQMRMTHGPIIQKEISKN